MTGAMTPHNNRILTTFSVIGMVALGMMLSVPEAFAQTNFAPTNIAALPTTSDLFAGQDKPGPYSLTWKKLPPLSFGKPTVVIDDKELSEGAYTMDVAAGTITFQTSIKAASMVHIVYTYDPASSERNSTAATAPVTVPMVRAGGAQLQLTAMPGGVANRKIANGSENDTLLIWKLSGAPMNAFGGRITTNALMAPGASTQTGGEDGLWDRSGVSVGYRLGNDNSGMDAGFTRSGREFAPTVAKTFQMSDVSAQTRSLAARYALAPWMRAEWKQNDTAYLTDGAGDASSQVMGLRLGGTQKLPSLNLLRTTDGRTDGKGITNEKTTDRLEMSAKLGKTTALNGTAQQVQTENAGKTGEKSTEMALTMQTQSGDKSQAATVAVTTATKESTNTEQAKTGVALTLQASPSVTIVAAQQKEATTTSSDKASDKTTEKAQSSAQAKISLAPGASVSGGLAMNSDADKNTNVTTMSAKLGEGKAIEVSQLVVNRGGNVGGSAVLETRDTRVALRPMRGLTLSGALTNNPETNGQVTEANRREMGLTAKVGSLQLGSGYTTTEFAAQNGLQKGEFSVTMGLRFNRYTMLSGEYKDGLCWGDGPESLARGLRRYSLGLTHDIGTALNFSMGGFMAKDKTSGAIPDDYKAEAKLGVKF